MRRRRAPPNTSSRKPLRAAGWGRRASRAAPFEAFIDDWRFVCEDDRRCRIDAKAQDFAYRLNLSAEGPLVLHGDKGFSRKSEQGQASYYYSQPFFRVVDGVLALRGREVKVMGRAWMDHEWASQPMSPDQKGWDWFALQLADGAKLMLFRYRGATNHLAGTWIEPDGATRALTADEIALTPLEDTVIGDRRLPDEVARNGEEPRPRHRDHAAQRPRVQWNAQSLLGGTDHLSRQP